MLNIKNVKLRSEQDIMSSWNGKDNIIVTIVCATYNHAEYIEDSITSFLMQETNFAFEIIIHDDASTDKTADIVREYQSKYPNIIKPIFQEENQFSKGDFRPTVYAERYAQGIYIARCEGDDYWVVNNKLQLQYDFLNNNAKYVICGTNSSVVNNMNCIVYENRWLHKGYKVLMTPTVMYRKTELPETFWKYFKNIPNADTAFFMFLETKGKAYLMDIISTAYRVSETGIWSTTGIEKRLLMSASSWSKLLYWANETKNGKSKAIFSELVSTYSKLVVFYFKNLRFFRTFKYLFILMKLFTHKNISKQPNAIFITSILLRTIKNHKDIKKVNY